MIFFVIAVAAAVLFLLSLFYSFNCSRFNFPDLTYVCAAVLVTAPGAEVVSINHDSSVAAIPIMHAGAKLLFVVLVVLLLSSFLAT